MSNEHPVLNFSPDRLKLLYEVSNVINSTLDSQKALQLIVREAVRVMQASSGSVALLNPTTHCLEIHAAYNLSAGAKKIKLRVGEGITGWVAQTGITARIGDVRLDNRYICVRQNIRSELAVPLESRGEIRGVLNVDSIRLNAFSQEDQDLLQELAFQAVRVIEHTWLYDQLRLKVELLESLSSVSQTINSTVNLDEALQVITREAVGLMRCAMCSLMLLDDSSEWLDLRASYGAGKKYLKKPRLSATESLIGVVVRRKKAIQVLNVQTDSRYQNIEVAVKEGLVSLLSIPLVFSGESIGALNIYTSEPYTFSNEEINILTAMADLSAIAIQKNKLHERIVAAEEQLRQSEKLSALGLLAAEVAHEIRNPLTVIKLLFHSLNLKYDRKDPRLKDAKLIESKIDQLNKIVERSLAFARSSEPKLSPTNLNDLIRELRLLVRHKFFNQGIKFFISLEPGLPFISGDRPQLEQAFLNLILNASEAMPNGGILRITTKLIKNETVIVEFKDNGIGMTQEQQKSAFKTALSSTKPSGTGIGLAITGKIIDAHRGIISIRSKSNLGTSIQIKFPVNDVQVI